MFLSSNEPFPKLVSDHKLVSFTIPCRLCNHHDTRSFQFIFSKGDYNGLNEFFHQADDMTQFYNSNDIESLWSFLKSLIFDGCAKFVPKSKFPNFQNGTLVKLSFSFTR